MRPLDANRPTVVGFDVPPLEKIVDHRKGAPVVAMLSCVPSEQWVSTFMAELSRIQGVLLLADLQLSGR